MIIIDAFRPKNLSLFGYGKETDSNLKKIAKEGVVFKNFFSSSNATAPSLMSIFTGKFQNNHGVIHQFPYTTEEEIERMYRKRKFWLPFYLKSKGYETMAIDWIDMFFKDGFDYYKEREEWQGKAKSSAKFPPAEDTMNLAIFKIKEATRPFFLFVHFWDTHFPFPTIKYKGTQKKDIDEILGEIKDKFQKEYFKKRVKGADIYSIEDMIGKYDAAIKEIDRQIGKLYKYLRNQNLWEETILVVLGDHGTNLTEHGIYFSSSSLFDETIHAPLIAHFPGFEAREISGFAQNVDIAPTILELIGEKAKSQQFDGRSMISLVKNNEEIRDKVFFFDGLCQNVKGMRTRSRKVIVAKDPKCNLCKSTHHREKEIYDLKKDPKEERNIYSKEKDNLLILNELKD